MMIGEKPGSNSNPNAYERSMSLGGSKPLPELFRAADLPFDFGPDTVRPYANELHSVTKAS